MQPYVPTVTQEEAEAQFFQVFGNRSPRLAAVLAKALKDRQFDGSTGDKDLVGHIAKELRVEVSDAREMLGFPTTSPQPIECFLFNIGPHTPFDDPKLLTVLKWCDNEIEGQD